MASGMEKNLNRRSVLSNGAKLIGASSMPMIWTQNAQAYTNDPGDNSTVLMGVNVPLTGPYSDGGREQVDALKLAIQHINGDGDGGMLNTMQPLSLKGDGINGKKLDMVIGDSRTNPEVAVKSAQNMVESDGVVMLTGGSITSGAIKVQEYAQEAGVIAMTVVAGGNGVTGQQRRKVGFRHFYSAYMSVAALTPILKENFGTDRVATMVTVGNPWGETVAPVMEEFMTSIGWKMADGVADQVAPMDTKDFAPFVEKIKNSDADVVILNLFGSHQELAIRALKASGILDHPKNGNKFEIVAQVHSRKVAQALGKDLQGIYGTLNWHWTLQDPGSKAFVMSFGKEYGYPPSQNAHTAYVQALLWANACQQAGTFNPCAVAEALEGLEFDGLGNGKCLYRAADHQVFKDIVIAQGKLNPVSEYDLLEVVGFTPRAKVEYSPDSPLFKGDLGTIAGC